MTPYSMSSSSSTANMRNRENLKKRSESIETKAKQTNVNKDTKFANT